MRQRSVIVSVRPSARGGQARARDSSKVSLEDCVNAFKTDAPTRPHPLTRGATPLLEAQNADQVMDGSIDILNNDQRPKIQLYTQMLSFKTLFYCSFSCHILQASSSFICTAIRYVQLQGFPFPFFFQTIKAMQSNPIIHT